MIFFNGLQKAFVYTLVMLLNRDISLQLLNKLKQHITSLSCENIFIAGDFKAVTNATKISNNNLFNIDAANVKQNKFLIRKIVQSWMNG